MGRLTIFSFLFTAFLLSNAKTVMHKVFPIPQEFEEGDDILYLDPCLFEISHNQKYSPIDITPILTIYKSRIFGEKILECPVLNNNSISPKHILNIIISSPIHEYFPSKIESTDESYSIEITQDSTTIKANQYSGLVHALESFSRLIEPSKTIKNHYEIENIPISLQDSPRFAYRGIMIDTSRHFLQVSTLMRVIDGMVMAKMSVLHWHIVDDDSFPMQSLSYPTLTNYAAFSASQIYNSSQIQSIVKYANIRAIRIIPEFDNPGHVRAVGLSPTFLPLVTCFNTQWTYQMPNGPVIYGGPPTGALDPSNSQTYSFIQGIFQDLNAYFPDSYVHLGGDEVLFSCWSSVPAIVKFMKDNNIPSYSALTNYYINRARGVLTTVNSTKTAIYWLNEATFYLQVKPTDVLEFWGFTSNLTQLASLYPNNKIIVATGDRYYLDCGMANKYGGNSWCDPFHTWWEIYILEPTDYLSANQILGGEVTMFAELVNDFVLDWKIWPRAAAMAQRYWNQNLPLNLTGLVSSLNSLVNAMNSQGIGAGPIDSNYCNLNPNICFGSP